MNFLRPRMGIACGLLLLCSVTAETSASDVNPAKSIDFSLPVEATWANLRFLYDLDWRSLEMRLKPLSSLPSDGPSFSCGKATTDVEKAICASPLLSKLDLLLAAEYRRFRAALPEDQKATARALQLLWMKNRGAECKFTLEQIDKPTLSQCITSDYMHWLDAIQRNFLLARVPLNRDQTIKVPFGHDLTVKVDLTDESKPDDEGNVYEQVFRQTLQFSSPAQQWQIFDNRHYGEGVQHSTELATHLTLYLASSGKQHMALEHWFSSEGGRCGSEQKKSQKFLNISDPNDLFAKVTRFDAIHSCGSYTNRNQDWFNRGGNPVFITGYTSQDDARFYYTKTIRNEQEIDSAKHQVISAPYIDPDIPLPEFELTALLPRKGDSECTNVWGAIYTYTQIYEAMGANMISFDQAEYMMNAGMIPANFDKALSYRPVIEMALIYLEKARSVDGWENRLVEATRTFPTKEYGPMMSYSEYGMEEDPFISRGFYTDNGCYANAPSPFNYANAEQWIYMFWARRVMQNQVEQAENIFRHILKLMDSYNLLTGPSQ